MIFYRARPKKSPLEFNSKVPGPTIDIDGVEMRFRYKDYFKVEPSTGYETLIYDCMIGDNILFQRADSVEAGWRRAPSSTPGRRPAPRGLKTYRPAAKGPRKRRRCWRATAEAGES